eukprot:CAMPEP_0204211856 /NCGR_PEP_ID=MMETSP0361-20130328/74794_1 /ASSEMBLY_ACC=CAM_ASM_000343 /TAXON_ID=268821 /ORGANISM="Scrippsiella Hangoei, Strain SHTV-5" /LENGTH=104 /DNA_ID=CAMNT_0051176097 /DNA_START=56 /DNA_END=366 /DNA_ORIENTATION=+
MPNYVAAVELTLEPNVLDNPVMSNADSSSTCTSNADDDENRSDMLMDDALHTVPKGRAKKPSRFRESSASVLGMLAVVPDGDSDEESQKAVASSLQEAAPCRRR